MMLRIASILTVLAACASLSSALSPLAPIQRSTQSTCASTSASASDASSLATAPTATARAATTTTTPSTTRRSFVGAATAAAAGVATAVVATTTAGFGSATAPAPAFAIDSSPSGLPTKGARAPDFELPNSRGNGLVTLDGLVKNAKWTVLYFYPGAFTSGCTLEARGFQKDMEEYRKLNAQVVGVSVDPVEKNAQFCTEEKLDFFMLSDKGGVVSKKYGSALSIPGFGTFSNRQTYIIDPNGGLRWIFTDVESKIARHSSEVLEKLTELEQQQM